MPALDDAGSRQWYWPVQTRTAPRVTHHFRRTGYIPPRLGKPVIEHSFESCTQWDRQTMTLPDITLQLR
jgi:hypothetical protein